MRDLAEHAVSKDGCTGRRKGLLFLAVLGVVGCGASLRASLCQGQCCCGGPSTLTAWECKGSGDDSDDNSSPFSHPISADRPGFGDSPTTVGCGVCQIELGYQYTYDKVDFGSHINHSYPQSLLRCGVLATWFELRLSW